MYNVLDMNSRKISLNCSLKAPVTSNNGTNTPNTPEILNTIVNITSNLSDNVSKKTEMPKYRQSEEQTKGILERVVNKEYSSIPAFNAPQILHSSIFHPSKSPQNFTNKQEENTVLPIHCQETDTGTFFQPNKEIAEFETKPNIADIDIRSPEMPTVQQYHSLFVKEGLKHKVQQNLKIEPGQEPNNIFLNRTKRESEELTHEDEERRKRRRERNKVAATKCRNKKKEKTILLVSEGETLEMQNKNLKQEIGRLEAEKRHLNDILSMHESSCKRQCHDFFADEKKFDVNEEEYSKYYQASYISTEQMQSNEMCLDKQSEYNNFLDALKTYESNMEKKDEKNESLLFNKRLRTDLKQSLQAKSNFSNGNKEEPKHLKNQSTCKAYKFVPKVYYGNCERSIKNTCFAL